MKPEHTYFAPAERAEAQKLKEQVDLFSREDGPQLVGNAMPMIFLILNKERQIVYANNRVLDVLGVEEFRCAIGKRIGELFHCVHSTEEAGGCGTSRHCENCGALNATLESQKGAQSIKECRLTMEGELSADYSVWATPHLIDSQMFTFFTLQDIQHEKRRKALERTFFHDILNTAGGISGLTEVLGYVDDATEREELFGLLNKSSHKLIEEIRSGRALSLAENGELKLELVEIDLAELMDDCISSYRNHPVGIGKQIKISEDSPSSLLMQSDRSLLGRIISNLIKNALEASDEGGLVTIGCHEDSEGIMITVHNSTVMPPHVKAQVFQRSFSTKGEGRGIGTYSIRLLTEKYLEGEVSFSSEEGQGTSFYIKLNKELPRNT
jgi:nitrogen-specific signal transduction histidine kinase